MLHACAIAEFCALLGEIVALSLALTATIRSHSNQRVWDTRGTRDTSNKRRNKWKGATTIQMSDEPRQPTSWQSGVPSVSISSSHFDLLYPRLNPHGPLYMYIHMCCIAYSSSSSSFSSCCCSSVRGLASLVSLSFRYSICDRCIRNAGVFSSNWSGGVAYDMKRAWLTKRLRSPMCRHSRHNRRRCPLSHSFVGALLCCLSFLLFAYC